MVNEPMLVVPTKIGIVSNGRTMFSKEIENSICNFNEGDSLNTIMGKSKYVGNLNVTSGEYFSDLFINNQYEVIKREIQLSDPALCNNKDYVAAIKLMTHNTVVNSLTLPEELKYETHRVMSLFWDEFKKQYPNLA